MSKNSKHRTERICMRVDDSILRKMSGIIIISKSSDPVKGVSVVYCAPLSLV